MRLNSYEQVLVALKSCSKRHNNCEHCLKLERCEAWWDNVNDRAPLPGETLLKDWQRSSEAA